MDSAYGIYTRNCQKGDELNQDMSQIFLEVLLTGRNILTSVACGSSAANCTATEIERRECREYFGLIVFKSHSL